MSHHVSRRSRRRRAGLLEKSNMRPRETTLRRGNRLGLVTQRRGTRGGARGFHAAVLGLGRDWEPDEAGIVTRLLRRTRRVAGRVGRGRLLWLTFLSGPGAEDGSVRAWGFFANGAGCG